MLSFVISATDPDGDTLTYSASNLPSGATFDAGTRTFSWTPSFTQAGSYPGVHFEVSDGSLTDSEDITITVNDGTVADTQGPLISNVMANPNPLSINTSANITAIVDDSTTGGSVIATAQYRIDSGSWTNMDASDGDFDGAIENVTANMAPFTIPGVHTVEVRGQDTAGNWGAPVSILLAVYDPAAGFVTGGGWINSPAGAYSENTTLTGKATFGFVSKYQRGANRPTGITQFQFKVAGLNFHSDSYEWLVIAGARAQYKGSGTINGTGDYGFMLTAADGQISGGGGIDKFRIKIWDKATDQIIYDNQMGKSDTGEDATQLGGGNIVIHAK